MTDAPLVLSPKDLLYPKQRAFIDDHAQYKIGVTTRQWGKSTVTSGEAVHDCLVDPGTKWVCMSAGERQSIEWLSKAKEWQYAYKMAVVNMAEDRGGMAEGLLRSTEISFANGSKIIAIPSNPATARGYSANVILDEFAYHEDPAAIWSAMFPSTTNKLAGTFLDRWRALVKGEATDIRRNLKLRVVSTFNGRNNKFFQLWEKAAANGYSAHKVSIHDAIADGMPLDAQTLRLALDDPDAWAQEYECEPMDSSAVLLPYELIALCESPEASTLVAPDFWFSAAHPGPLTMGIDFARKKDLSVAWTNERVGDVGHTRELLEMRAMSTPDQIDLLRPRIKRCQRVCLDYTGPGIGMGDYLVKEFGEWDPARHLGGKIELVTFTQNIKVELFTKLRMAFEAKRLRIPVDRAIREDLHSMQRVTSANGGITYRAPHTDDGHADRCTALALCHRASSQNPAWLFTPRPAGRRSRNVERSVQ
ncbi:MAG: Mu-like prophage FluMu protein gp28 [Verrucomicrobia bacterium]|nr:MAG: Mu-like prophage FluMu protein gp28 [Verrucomicrobiota bacterium]